MRYFLENFKSIGKILVVMYVTTSLLLFLLAFLVQKLQWEQGMISIGISIVYFLSCFMGGFLAGKVQKTKKFVWGILLGMMYVLTMLAVTLIFQHGFHGSSGAFMINLLLCLGSGMLGGMLS